MTASQNLLDCACDVPAKPMSKEQIWAWARIIIAGVLSGNAMAMALTINMSYATAMARFSFHAGLIGTTVVVALLVGGAWFKGLWTAVRTRRFSVEGLFLLGMIGSFIYSIFQMNTPDGAVYFEVIAVLMVIYALGVQIKKTTQSKVMQAAENWSPGNMQALKVQSDGAQSPVSVDQVLTGDRVVVKPGQVIPVDGVIESGRAWLRESEMTGEAYAVSRAEGDEVLAATLNLDGDLLIRATKDGVARRIDDLLKAVEKARANRSPIEMQAERLSHYFLPIVAGVCLIILLSWGFAYSWEQALLHAMAALIVACPCALGFATPVGIWAGLARLAQMGLVAKTGEVVETLARVDTVVFDKTGTLSDPQPRLVGLELLDSTAWDQETLMHLLRAAESSSDHPVAKALRLNAPASSKMTQYEIIEAGAIPAEGYEARLQSKATEQFYHVQLINRQVMDKSIDEESTRRYDWLRLIEQLNHAGADESLEHHLAILVNEDLVGMARVDEDLLASQPEVFARLKDMGLEVQVMSGDQESRLERLAVEKAKGSMTPEDKRQAVVALKAAGKRVLFVGDGVNDAAAMAEADVSIAVAEGAELALESAQISWVGRDLHRVVDAIRVCRSSLKIVKSNLVIAVIYNVIGLGVAAAGLVNPVVAVIIMLASSLVVSIRAASALDEDDLVLPDD